MWQFDLRQFLCTLLKCICLIVINLYVARGTRESESSNAGRSHHGAPTVTSSVIRTFGNKKRKKLRCSQKKIQSEHHSATPACPAVMASPAIRHVKPGDRVVVETICTKTQASVVWQVESNVVLKRWINLVFFHKMSSNLKKLLQSAALQVNYLSFENYPCGFRNGLCLVNWGSIGLYPN